MLILKTEFCNHFKKAILKLVTPERNKILDIYRSQELKFLIIIRPRLGCSPD